MAKFPKKPRTGQKTIASLYRSICQIIDYLPSLTVKGDGRSTSVSNTSKGSIISVKSNNNSQWKYEGDYPLFEFGDGIKAEYEDDMVSGLDGVPKELLPKYVSLNIVGDNEYISAFYPTSLSTQNSANSAVVIKYIGPTPSGGGGGSGSGHSYIGDGNTSSGHIFVGQSGSDPRLISSDLVMIDDLNNYDITSSYHFLQVSDMHEGAGTTVNYHYNSKGDHTVDGGGPDTLVKWIDGIEVDLNVSGGQYITTNFYKGVGYGDYSSASINCNLSGQGFITIVPQYDNNDNVTGGIISTNLHAGSGITIDPQTGEITATGGGGGGPDNDTTYTGGRFIYVESTGDNPHPISCTLSTLAELENTPGYVTSANFYAGKNILLSCEITTANNNVNIGTEEDPIYERIDVPVANSIKIINLLSGGTNIEVDDQTHAINCTLSGLDQLANTATNYITLADVPAAIPHIPASGIMSTALLDDNEQLTGIQYSLISSFYNDLTIISSRPSAGDFVLSSSAGTLSWQQNTGGGSGGGGGGGTALMSSSFFYTTGIVAAPANCQMMIMCNTPLKDGTDYFQYNFSDDFDNTIAKLTEAVGHAPVYLSSITSDVENGFEDDYGNVIVVLPEVTQPCFVKINIFEYSTATIAVSVNGKTIIDWEWANGWNKSGCFTQQLDEGNTGDIKHWMFFYIPSTSGWPSPNDGTYATAYQPINRTSGAWICYKTSF